MTRNPSLTEIAPGARIGIVGAGPSGLTAAHYLSRAGYENITLFERRDRVGGKCNSITVDGRIYELGAVFGTPCYHIIRDLCAHVGLEEGHYPSSRYYTPEGRRTGLVPWHRTPALLWQLFIRFPWLSKHRYQNICQPGLAGIHPDLFQNFETFAAQQGLRDLPPLFQPIATGFGYGYAEQVPAAYMLKYLSWPLLKDCARHKAFTWPDGIQTLWERLSLEHDVRLETEIKGVVRDRNQVVVYTADRHFDLDYLILACPLDNALAILDASETERDLFSRIRTYDYWVLLGEIEGLPNEIGFIKANFARENQGHLMLWYCRWPQTNLYAMYVLGDAQTSQDVIEANCAVDLRRLGATLNRVRAARRWRYFPHVSTADMAAGYYDKLEALQGQRRTFYCGEIMAFSTLECSARYARDLVTRYFEQITPVYTRAPQRGLFTTTG